MPSKGTVRLRRDPREQAPELARRFFGLPLGADEESAAVLRYYFEHALGHAGGLLPAELLVLELPPVPELFRIYRQRALADRPTGRWTRQQRRGAATPNKSKPRL